MSVSTTAGHGSSRTEGSTSGAAILAAFIPTFLTALVYLITFAAIRNIYPKIYAPRTFLQTIPEKDRTPGSSSKGASWFKDFRSLPDRFVLQHVSLDAYLYLRFLRFIIFVCFLGCCITFPVLLPINYTGGGTASQLDKISFSNIDDNSHLWGHVAVAWVLFGGILALLARERLQLIGTRQAYLLDPSHSSRLSARTVLFLHVPHSKTLPENLKSTFGDKAVRSWPVKDAGALEGLVGNRNSTVFKLESAELDLLQNAAKSRRNGRSSATGTTNDEEAPLMNKANRPTERSPPIIGTKIDSINLFRNSVRELADEIQRRREETPNKQVPDRSGVFVSFSDQAGAHNAYESISFEPKVPTMTEFLAPQPKEVLWSNIAISAKQRLSKESLALIFVIAFTIFFAIPVGIIGSISNVQYLAENFKWLAWVENLPPVVLGLLEGFVPPFLVSWFVSYVPKLFRHIAKLSGEPTTSQAELKTQAWYFAFQVVNVFLVTTFSSGAASVATSIFQDPKSAPSLLAENLPKASNFYLTYFILQGTSGAADAVLNYSDLFEYLFYLKFWDKTPREKLNTHIDMKNAAWGKLYPKFTNLLVIAIAYSCIAPLVLGFATIGLSIYYLAYRYNLLYVIQPKVQTKGEAYKRALQQIPTGIYLAELCLIGLVSARKAAAQTAVLIVLLVATALTNLILDRTLRPLELYLGIDSWREAEVPLLANEDDIPSDDHEALHVASHNRRLGLLPKLPRRAADFLSAYFDSIASASRRQVKSWLHESSPDTNNDDDDDDSLLDDSQFTEHQLSASELESLYTNPAFVTPTPKVWIPRDAAGFSRGEIDANAGVGIGTTDEGAWLDEWGRVQWSWEDLERVPVWKKGREV